MPIENINEGTTDDFPGAKNTVACFLNNYLWDITETWIFPPFEISEAEFFSLT